MLLVSLWEVLEEFLQFRVVLKIEFGNEGLIIRNSKLESGRGIRFSAEQVQPFSFTIRMSISGLIRTVLLLYSIDYQRVWGKKIGIQRSYLGHDISYLCVCR